MQPIQPIAQSHDYQPATLKPSGPANRNSTISFKRMLEGFPPVESTASTSVAKESNKPGANTNPLLIQGPELPVAKTEKQTDPLREAFHDFVGQTFFGQMLASMRSSQQPSAYFNGGRAEEVFRGQLDQVLSETLSESSADQIAEPMYKLFRAQQKGSP